MAAQNIFTQFAQPVRSVAEHMADYDAQDMRRMQIEGGQRQNALAALTQRQTMKSMADADADRNALQAVAGGWNAQTTADQRIAGLRNSGRAALMTQADLLEKQAIERTKGDAEAKAKQAEVLGKVLTAQGELAKRVLASPTPQAAAAAIANMKALTQSLGVQIDFSGDEAALSQFQSPDQIKQWAAGHALKADQLLPKLQALNAGGQFVNQAVDPVTGQVADTGRTAITQSADNAATQATARANQARMSADAAAGRAQSASQFSQRLAYDKDKDTRTAASGGNITEGERNAGGYAARMTDASKLLDQFENNGRSTYKTDALGGVPLVGRALQTSAMSADQQRYRQAQEDWVRAKLRKESGAAIGQDEMAREISAYFPEPGDRPENVAQKRQAREVANRAMVQSAGRGAQKATATQPPEPGAVLRFDAQGNPVK